MKWLNYNHLHYFWVVAREGGVVRASEALLVSRRRACKESLILRSKWIGGQSPVTDSR